ncbi:Rne/Rng family ribonuclease [Candidatus Cetobacterium colombiensis]|uniref:Rne/Rng family ribonuclease n=1 Tax=Candidatus Cetobacterium colombiensis TaxID=3073100 RepID=A0ABU4WBR3_9FUSO|nr:Rne/Rng family ribonuclease [Candidatus Cetobacterium colombiensis]MDX8336664.1 Rne/Rng family ribonuclease [Candidatus Cetobacterium colombiensis]
MNQIIINTNRFKTRAAVLENGRVMEVHIEREGEGTLNGNIYKGKVANVLPGMESAFVNIGLEKNGFLYVKDLRDFEEKYLTGIVNSEKPIEDLLRVGDEVVVQVLSDPRGSKGARVTTHYTIPGKFLVLMPNNNHIAISKKIKSEEERERLEQLFSEIVPEGMGVIIRTAAEGKTIYHFEKELQYLIKKWEEIEIKMKGAKTGDLLYKDNGIVSKVLRDIIGNDIDEIIVDNEDVYWEIIDYIRAFTEGNPKIKIKLYTEKEEIFEKYGIQKEIENSLEVSTMLECGGSIVIEKTEALVSIDVNTGKNIGSMNLEETVVKTNIEAAEEIARQLRIRNLSGIIIIDFIDMKVEEDKQKVLKVLEENLAKDRVKTNIIHFTDLGLVEMTRKRLGKPLSYYFQDECPVCKGTGKIKGSRAIVESIIKELKEVIEEKDIKNIKILTKASVKEKIDEIYLDFIKELLKKYGKTIEVTTKNRDLLKDYEIVLES